MATVTSAKTICEKGTYSGQVLIYIHIYRQCLNVHGAVHGAESETRKVLCLLDQNELFVIK